MKQQNPKQQEQECVLCTSFYALIAYLENVFTALSLFLFKTTKQQSGDCIHGVCATHWALAVFVAFLFENASCRMAINAHSWKLLSLFTQQRLWHLEMGKN